MREPELFNFVIARLWPGTNSLCCYAYGSQVMHGDQAYADSMLKYVNTQSKEKFHILKISIDSLPRDEAWSK